MGKRQALLGGTFDPVHNGHLAVARAALSDPRFHLQQIIFVPADIPPHKQTNAITPYADRYAMLELALRGEARFSLSRMEDPAHTQGHPNYSLETVRRFKQEHHVDTDDLYFIVGMDSFLNISSWREPEQLIKECRMVVATRPGFTLADVRGAVPRAVTDISNIFLLESVWVDVSATTIRAAVRKGEPLDKYVPEGVAEYIQTHALYR